MTSGVNNFNDFLEIVPTGEVTARIEKIVHFSRPWPWAYFSNGPNAAASGFPRLFTVTSEHICLFTF